MSKKNYKYGKLVDEQLVYAPNTLHGVINDEDGNEIAVQIINGSPKQYADDGWLPIIRIPQPESVEGGYYIAKYVEQDGTIVESWCFVPYEELEQP